jgi:4-hydroxybenzoate polyprenyltransferase
MSYNLQTLWIFTASDAHTFIPSQAAFGVVSCLSGPLLTTVPEMERQRGLDVLARLPLILAYLWFNVLLFNIANQRLPESIQEDTINKPWRPLPSHRLTPEQARAALQVVIPVTVVVSTYTGGIEQAVIHMVLTWMYNDLGGAMHPVLKNIYNALGIVCYSSGAAAVACSDIPNRRHGLNILGWKWIAILSAIVFTSIHVQDLRDRKGDEAAGRHTLPVALGDMSSRWLLAVGILASSLGCPAFWAANVLAYSMVAGMGSVLALRILIYRDEASDRFSWKLWPCWMIMIYIVPLLPA